MQQGVFLLWVICVGVSLGVWIYLEVSLSRYGSLQTRRKLTGYELARQILDRHQSGRVPIEAVPQGRDLGASLDKLFLREEDYRGSRLAHLARSLFGATRLLVGSKSVASLYLRGLGERSFQWVIVSSWVLVLLGAAFRFARPAATLGQILFVLSGLLAVASLGEEFEVGKRSVSNLMSVEGFELDEKVRMKKLLESLRWWPFALLIQAPFSLSVRSSEKSSHVLSKSK